MKPFDVVHVIPYYRPATAFGGPVVSVSGLAEEQARQGLRVAVVTTDAAARPAPGRAAERLDAPDEEWLDGVFVSRAPLLPVALWYAAPSVPARLDRLLEPRTVVHVHGIFSFPLAWGCLSAALRGLPLVVAPRGTLDADLIRRRGRFRKRPYLRLVEGGPYARRALFHATSAKEAEDVVNLFPQARTVVVPNGLPASAFERPVASTASRDFRVVYVGRLSWTKGIDRLVEGFRAAAIPGSSLRLAGEPDPGEEEAFRKIAGSVGDSPVTFLGHVAGDAKRELVASASVVALLSPSENFGLSAAEAMAGGVPVLVSSGVGVAPDVVVSRGGWVVDSADRGAVAEALREIASSPEERSVRGANARRFAESSWAWRPLARRMTGIYDDEGRRLTAGA